MERNFPNEDQKILHGNLKTLNEKNELSTLLNMTPKFIVAFWYAGNARYCVALSLFVCLHFKYTHGLERVLMDKKSSKCLQGPFDYIQKECYLGTINDSEDEFEFEQKHNS